MHTHRKLIHLIIVLSLLLGGALALSSCSTSADVASQNLSKEADNFQIYRRIVFYNGITDKYIVEVDGFCSIGNNDGPGYVSITCKTGPDKFIKDHFFKSDNTTVFSEQLQGVDVSTAHYRVVFKPSVIIPDIKLR